MKTFATLSIVALASTSALAASHGDNQMHKRAVAAAPGWIKRTKRDTGAVAPLAEVALLTVPNATTTTSAATTTTTQVPEWYNGTALWFSETGNQSACYTVHTDDDHVVGLSTAFWADPGVVSDYCGQYMLLKNTATGAEVTCLISDASGSQYTTLTKGAFKIIGDVTVGMIDVEFYFLNATMKTITIDASSNSTATTASSALAVSNSTVAAAGNSTTVAAGNSTVAAGNSTSVFTNATAAVNAAAVPVSTVLSSTTAPTKTTSSAGVDSASLAAAAAASSSAAKAAAASSSAAAAAAASSAANAAWVSSSKAAAAAASSSAAAAAYASSSAANAAWVSSSRAAAAAASSEAAQAAYIASSKAAAAAASSQAAAAAQASREAEAAASSSAAAQAAASSRAAAAAASSEAAAAAASSEAAAAAASASAAASVITGGYATYFYQNGVAGNCGTVHQDSGYGIAMQTNRYDNGANCGRQIAITRTDTGASVTATVWDSCPTCLNDNCLDLSVAAFTAIATEEEGQVPISWSFV